MTKATSSSKGTKKVSKKEQRKQKEEESSDSSSAADSDSSDDASSDSENEEEEEKDAASSSEKDANSSSDDDSDEEKKSEAESDSDDSSENEEEASEEEEESEDGGKRKAASDVEMNDSEDDSDEKSAKKQKTDDAAEETKLYSVFVGNLSFSVTDESLATAFGEFGEVVAARVAMQPNSDRSRGFGYVDFATEEARDKATSAGEFELEGRAVRMEKTDGHARDGRQSRAQQGGSQPSTNEPSKVLFIGNMSFRSTEDSVRVAFEECGTVLSVRIITDRETGRPKGYGYIEFDTVEAAANAMQWNGTDLDGRNIRLDYSTPRTNGGGGRGGGRGGFGGGRGGGRGGFGGGRGGGRGGFGGGRGRY
ncbi:nuclear localization sequence binding protein [Coemansia sp. RSA 2559]|nr:nuclear localization sequence binding protein [Coemansia sp. RSA 2559]